MKPRLQSCALTGEDNHAWAHVGARVAARWKVPAYHQLTLYHGSRISDGRDADLMLVLGWWRVQQFARRWRFAAEAAEFPGLAAGDDWWQGGRA